MENLQFIEHDMVDDIKKIWQMLKNPQLWEQIFMTVKRTIGFQWKVIKLTLSSTGCQLDKWVATVILKTRTKLQMEKKLKFPWNNVTQKTVEAKEKLCASSWIYDMPSLVILWA